MVYNPYNHLILVRNDKDNTNICSRVGRILKIEKSGKHPTMDGKV
jgi:hypothetical protein